MEWLYASIAGFASAVIGALGMGGGGVLLIYLTAFAHIPQLKAQGVNLLFFIPVAVIALIFHCRNRLVDYKAALWGLLTGIPGVLAGYSIAQGLGDQWLSKIFACLLLALGIKELCGDLIAKWLRKTLPLRNRKRHTDKK